MIDLAGARRVLVVAPHSDDETIAALDLITALLRSRVDVALVVVTDGAASHRRSARWPPARLVAERRRETLRAMRRVGLPHDRVRFLGFPDGGLDSLAPARWRSLVLALARGPLPDAVIVPDRDDAHPDHRDVARACRAAWPARVRRLAYTVWPAAGAAPVLPSRRVALPANAARKRATLRLYRTQTGLIRDDPDGFALTPAQIREKCGPVERFVRG